MPEKAGTVDEYLAGVPEPDRKALEKLRKTIMAAAPGATETISYHMPTFKEDGPLVAYAAFKDHLSFFVMSTEVMEAHRGDLDAFDTSRGAIRFTPDRPLPAALVKKLVRARVEENRRGRGPYTRRKPAVKRARHPMPDYVERELEGRGLMDSYRRRPPYQQNDYIGWITGAKQEATRQRRLEQMLEELESGHGYMKMPYEQK